MQPVQYHVGGFPPENLDWTRLIPFIGPATASVARYDGTLAVMPSPRVLLAPLITREAVLSSRIEGTQTTMGEVLGFETLHPFLDGNGRLGRLLVPLFLWQHGHIREPTFYISAYFEAHRDAYYEGLLAVSRDGDWTGWCRFFLQAVQAQAEDNLTKAQGILDLYEDMKKRVADLTRSRYAIHALDWIFERPIFGAADFVVGTSGTPRTARRILDVLCRNDILRVVMPGSGRRTAVLAFPGLLDIVDGERVI